LKGLKKIDPGVWYVRLVDPANKKALSPVNQFTVQKPAVKIASQVPTAGTPAPEVKIAPIPSELKMSSLKNDQLDVELKWDVAQAPEGTRYEVRVGAETFTSTRANLTLDPSLLFANEEQKVFVRTLPAQGTPSEWSEMKYQKEDYELGALVKTPVKILYPSPNTRILSSSGLDVEWIKPKTLKAKISHMEIEVSSDSPKFKKLVQKIPGERFQTKSLPVGNYTVKVRAYFEGHGYGATSPREFSVVRGAGLDAPILRRPAGK
jgi:hypothetical protein